MKNYAVIGVGNFGYFLCKAFSAAGHDVLAVDASEEAAQRVMEVATKVVIADATDRSALEALGLEEFDVVLVSLGEHIDASVLTTLYLKEIGVERLVVKAISIDHGKVLERVGADEVVFPERDMADRVVYRLVNTDVLDFISIGTEYSLMEWAPPQVMVGKTLAQLDFRKEHNVQVILVRSVVPEGVTVAPDGTFVVKDSDILVILGHNEDLDRIRASR